VLASSPPAASQLYSCVSVFVAYYIFVSIIIQYNILKLRENDAMESILVHSLFYSSINAQSFDADFDGQAFDVEDFMICLLTTGI